MTAVYSWLILAGVSPRSLVDRAHVRVAKSLTVKPGVLPENRHAQSMQEMEVALSTILQLDHWCVVNICDPRAIITYVNTWFSFAHRNLVMMLILDRFPC